MKSEHQQRVEELMVKAKQEVPNKPTIPDARTRILRAKLILEEAIETVTALGVDVVFHAPENSKLNQLHGLSFYDNGKPNLIEIADGCWDIRVVTTGTLSACGIHDEEGQIEVDKNNLAKFDNPNAYWREDGKFVKAPDHPKPDIESIIQNQSKGLQRQ